MPTFEEAKAVYPKLTREEFDASIAAHEALPLADVEYHAEGGETVHEGIDKPYRGPWDYI